MSKLNFANNNQVSSGKDEDPVPVYITMKKSCEIAHCSRWTIARWIQRGFVRTIKRGKAKSSRVLILVDSLYAFLASMEINIKSMKGGEAK